MLLASVVHCNIYEYAVLHCLAAITVHADVVLLTTSKRSIGFSMCYIVLGDNIACNSDVLLKLKILNGENHFYTLVSAYLEILLMEGWIIVHWNILFFSFSQVTNRILSRKKMLILLQLAYI